jgi:hypothetical protein
MPQSDAFYRSNRYMLIDADGRAVQAHQVFVEPTTGDLWLANTHIASIPTLHQQLWRDQANRLQDEGCITLDIYLVPQLVQLGVMRRCRVRYRKISWVPVDLDTTTEAMPADEWLILLKPKMRMDELPLNQAPPILIRALQPAPVRPPVTAPPAPAAPPAQPTPPAPPQPAATEPADADLPPPSLSQEAGEPEDNT